MASLREAQKEMTRRMILDAGLELFSTKGYLATTVEDIAGAVGTTRVTFYAHFPSKSELMKALMKSQGLQRHAALAKAARYVLGTPTAGGKDGLDPEEVRKQREIDARKKAADAARKQPADTSKAGKDSDKDGSKDGKIDVMKLSKARFDKLTEEELVKYRGDVVA